MHDLESESNVVDRRVVESPELLGKECGSCGRILAYKFYRADSSHSDGRRHQCLDCEASPRLSLEEHTARLREKNRNSEATKKQRWEDQEEYLNDRARVGQMKHSSEIVGRLKKLIPDLFITDGNIIGDLALYKTFGQPQPDLEGRSFQYIGYMPMGWMPEFSLYQYDSARDVVIKEDQRGWRSVLLKIIRAGLVTQEQCDTVFGKAEGPASTIWYRTLWKWKNQ